MTTLVTIKNAENSNGDVILDGTGTCEGQLRGVPLRPGESRDVWITTSSALILTETWPTRKKSSGDDGSKTIAECGDDGEKWAAAFTNQFPAADEDTMRAWFQNAIEAAVSVRRERIIREAKEIEHHFGVKESEITKSYPSGSFEADKANEDWKARGGVPAEQVAKDTGVTIAQAFEGPDLSKPADDNSTNPDAEIV